MSFDFTSFDVASCIEDCQQCIELIMQKEEDGIADLEAEDFKCELTAEDAALMKALFLKLESAISDVELDSNGCATKSASFLLDELGKLNINSMSRDQIVETIEQMSGLLAANKSKFFKPKHYALDKFSTIVRMIFSEDQDNRTIALNTKKFYKVHIQTEKEDDKKNKTLDVWATRSRATGSKEKPRTLSYWCFHPGLTMRNLMAQGVRSLIITSGTLSPLSSFKFELSIPFRVELENTHVIESHQVFVGILPQGPDGKILNSSYQHRSKPEYQISLGNTIINMSRIIPNGVLVFFPSYAVMDMIINKWQTCGIWERMATTKGLFVEPRRKGALNETMQQYYEKINDPALKGATFFAVCRGKVSEGLDFADANGRAVIITGLPFPPSQDPKVILKRQYLDEQKGTESITGQDWYRQQASRAVNQAIGRVIRHKSDYGAILLCDERFAYAQAKNHLPVWIKKQLREFRDFGSAQRELVMFFRNIKQKMGITDEAVEAKRKLDAIYDSTSSEGSDRKTAKAVKMEKPASASSVRAFSSKPTMNSLASSSLAQLEKLTEKKGSLFDSLKEKENRTTCEPSGPCSLSAKLLGNNIEYSVPTNVVKSKKYKIVKKCSSSCADSADTKTFSTQQTETKSCSLPQQNEASSSCKQNQLSEDGCNAKDDAKKEKLRKASKYIQTLKTALTTEKYKKFSEALNLYKKSRNVNVLMLQFEEIFDLTQSEHVSFVRDFSVFVRENDKGCFTKLADKMCSTTPS